MQYRVIGVRRTSLPSATAYCDLISAYQGRGEFIPFEEGRHEGNFNITITSDKRLNLDELRKKFPSLEILDLEEKIQ